MKKFTKRLLAGITLLVFTSFYCNVNTVQAKDLVQPNSDTAKLDSGHNSNGLWIGEYDASKSVDTNGNSESTEDTTTSKEFPPQLNVSSVKTWTITLASPTTAGSDVSKYVSVVDESRNTVTVKVKLDSTKKIITITPPENGYSNGTYYIVVNKNLPPGLKRDYKKKFTVTTTTTNSNVENNVKSSLGGVTFTSDNTNSVISVVPIGKEQNISVTDSLGNEWTLTIPKNAVPAGTKITMTPLENIKSDGYPCAITGGVRLEPDGLTFDDCGTLSVKMAKNVPSIMLTGNGDGKNLYFLNSKQGEDSVTSPITHFSTAYFQPIDDPNIKKVEEAEQRDYEVALENVKELLKQPIEVNPPPTISLECYGEEKSAQANNYANQCLQPESFYLQALVTHGSTMFFNKNEAAAKDSLEYAEKICMRLFNKADRILYESNQDPNKFLATFTAVARIHKLVMRFCTDFQVPSPSETFGAYAKKAADYCLKEIRTNHNFKYKRAAFEIDRLSQTLGNESRMQEIIDAFVFKMEFKLTFSEYTSGEQPLNSEWIITGNSELKPDSEGISLFTGDGVGKYAPLVSNFQGMSVDGNFPFTTWITKFDPCKSGTAEFRFDKLMADSETYWLLEMPSAKSDTPYVREFAEVFFPLQEDDKFVFNMPIKNGEAELCNYTASNSIGAEGVSGSMSVNIKLTHTPK